MPATTCLRKYFRKGETTKLTHLRTKNYVLVLALSALLVSCFVAPAAAREYSIWEWWTDQAKDVTDTTPIHPPWGAAYSAYTHDDVWNQMDIGKESWVVPLDPWDNGLTLLRVEYAGWSELNTFGWYNPADGSGPTVMNEIFGGSANTGAIATIDFSGYQGDTIGFYLGTPGSVTWYSEAALNSDTSTHVRVFEDVVIPDSWILAWEDKAMDTTDPVVYNYTDAWDKSKEPLKWYYESGNEPDYNDMILTFTWINDEGEHRTPELSTFALLGLSLVAVPVLRRRRRS
jgi:hypothetical protein